MTPPVGHRPAVAKSDGAPSRLREKLFAAGAISHAVLIAAASWYATSAGDAAGGEPGTVVMAEILGTEAPAATSSDDRPPPSGEALATPTPPPRERPSDPPAEVETNRPAAPEPVPPPTPAPPEPVPPEAESPAPALTPPVQAPSLPLPQQPQKIEHRVERKAKHPKRAEHAHEPAEARHRPTRPAGAVAGPATSASGSTTGKASGGIGSNAASQQAGDNGNARAAYAALVAAEINRRKFYPPAARETGAVGSITVIFTVGASGSIVSHTITRSSGSSALDAVVPRMMSSAHLPPPPGGVFRGSIILRFSM